MALSRIAPAVDPSGPWDFKPITQDILVHEETIFSDDALTLAATQHHVTAPPAHAMVSQPEAVDSKYTGADLLTTSPTRHNEYSPTSPWCVNTSEPSSPTADHDADVTLGTVVGIAVPAPPPQPDPRALHGGAASVLSAVSMGDACVGPPSPRLAEVEASTALGELPGENTEIRQISLRPERGVDAPVNLDFYSPQELPPLPPLEELQDPREGEPRRNSQRTREESLDPPSLSEPDEEDKDSSYVSTEVATPSSQQSQQPKEAADSATQDMVAGELASSTTSSSCLPGVYSPLGVITADYKTRRKQNDRQDEVPPDDEGKKQPCDFIQRSDERKVCQ